MRLIFLLLAPLFLMVIAFRSGNDHKISGTIKDENGNLISGVSITAKGSNASAVSNSNGYYSLVAQNKNAVLHFSAVGFASKDVAINGSSVVDVIMTATQASLNEVVITALGKDKQQRDMVFGQPQPGMVTTMGINGNAGYNQPQFNTEDYDGITENGFHKVADDLLSTFSIDVDAASYSNVRRFLNEGQLPPAGAVRIEEMINYFRYDYNTPKDKHPFAVHTELSDCPWNQKHKLVMIGLQGKKIPVENLPPSNLVFLIDVSGSMQGPLRLALIQSSLKLLVEQLREEDKISIVVYAGAAGLVLPSTSGNNKTRIKEAIDELRAGGSTAGGEGIKLAYKIAQSNFVKEGNNRVILCTDGDFNVGASSDDDMERLIEREREGGVFLTVLGYGMGNYKDNKMQKLANKGNGNHAYIDGLNEAKKVLVNEFGGTLFTIAKDVKLQVEFNGTKVAGYRLIGYENRLLNKEDFNNDKKDAGELGSGHTVTALYEIIPAGVESEFLKSVDSLKYTVQPKRIAVNTDELLTVKFRYKAPDGNNSEMIEHPVIDRHTTFNMTSDNFRFAVSVAGFGMLLRNSEFKGAASFNQVFKMASASRGRDAEGYRKEFIELVKKAAVLSKAEVEEDVAINE
jgi:Ca-activated chloride channel family protein